MLVKANCGGALEDCPQMELPVEAGAPGNECRRHVTLAPGATLFQDGAVREGAYRIERGAVCHYMRWGDGRHEVIEYAFPGDVVGLGFQARHVSTAQAMVETVVSPLSPDELAQELAANDNLSMRLAAAGDREFEALRARALAARPDHALGRVAAILLALAHAESKEPLAATLSTDEVAGAWVAGAANLSVSALEEALGALEEAGLIQRRAARLRLADAEALERLAEGA